MPIPSLTHRRGHLMVLACLLIAGPGGGQQDSTDAPIDLVRARQYFEEAKELSGRDAGTLWGTPLYGPMIFVDPRTRFIVTNAADAHGRLIERDRGLWCGELPAEVNIANTTIHWAGVQWAMIMWPLPDDVYARGMLMMHESFHRIQSDLGFELAIRNNAHLDDADGRIGMRLEWRALAEALAEDDPLESEALRDALAFRAWRQRRSRTAPAEEVAVELNEGLAEYTGVRLGGYGSHDQVRRSINMLRAYDRAANISRSFAYATGPAYGLLLDRADPDWRAKVGEARDLAGLLRRSIRLSLPVLSDEAIFARAEQYDGASIIEFERDRQAERDARIEELTRTFIAGPTVQLMLEGDMRFGFSPHGAETLPEYGSVYASMRITGAFGIIESSGPVLWVSETSSQHFRLPASESIENDGRIVRSENWTITLNDGWRVRRINRKGDHRVERIP